MNEKKILKYKSKNMPDLLLPVVNKWSKKGMRFYLGPENMFRYQRKNLQFKCNPNIPTTYGSWYVKSIGFKGNIPDLTKEQFGDIATHLIQYFKPVSWGLIVDYRCNYSCSMCPFQGKGYVGDYWTDRQSQKRIMPEDEAIQYIDKLAQNKVNRVVLTSPGELFLYPHWERVASYIAEKGLIVTIITNGSLINTQMCQRMIKAGIQEVNVSLDAVSQKIYAQVRSDQLKHYKTAMQAPLLLKKYGFKVRVNFVRQKRNIHEVDEFIKYWKDTEVDFISIGFQTEYHDGFSVDKIGYQKEYFIPGFCSWYGNFVILADGTVTACCMMQTLYKDQESHGLPKMHFLKFPYQDIVKRMNKLMNKDSPLNPICQKCSMYTIPTSDYYTVDGWKLIRTRGKESWERVHLISDRTIKRLNSLISDWIINSKRILIYGAGKHTDMLFKKFSLKEVNIVGLVDQDPYKKNKVYMGLKVFTPEDIMLIKPDVVLISSKAFQTNIYHNLSYLEKHDIEIIRIY